MTANATAGNGGEAQDNPAGLDAFYEAFAELYASSDFRSAAELVRATKISQATISGFITRNGSEPKAANVFRLEQAFGVQPGELSRHLGYLPVERWQVNSVEAAIKADRWLWSEARRVLLDTYWAYVELGRLTGRTVE